MSNPTPDPSTTDSNAGANSNPEKDPHDWVTGDEPMTGPQKSYLETMAQQAGDQIDPNLSKADASMKIDELQEKTGRGQ